MGFSKSQVLQWQANAARARSGESPAPKRLKRGAGEWSKRKDWWAEMARLPGEFVAVALVSNAREHHMVKANRVLEERKRGFYVGCRFLTKAKLPIVVTLTRYGTKLMDDDNLRGAFKGLRDGIADAFSTDDSAKGGIEFVYAPQVKTRAGQYGVRIVIEPKETAIIEPTAPYGHCSGCAASKRGRVATHQMGTVEHPEATNSAQAGGEK